MDSHYLGPHHPRVPLGTWDEVTSAAEAGVLDEGHWVELKEHVPAAARKANVELAKDLASLALDGGVLIIGIEDDHGAAGAVVGTPLQGLRTRISQVSHGSIRPPLPVVVAEHPHPSDPAKGLVVVTVPASLSAPHMVDDRYWGRSPEGKRALGDVEVRRVMEALGERRAGFADRLARVREHDPYPAPSRTNSHLYLLAEPIVAGSSQRLSRLLDQGAAFRAVAQGVQGGGPQHPPSVARIGFVTAHPDGFEFRYNEASSSESDSLVVVLRDDGGLRLISGRASDQRDGQRLGLPTHVVESVHQGLRLAALVAQSHLGFNGLWQIGVHLDRLRGLRTYRARIRIAGYMPDYPNDDFESLSTATTDDLIHSTSRVVSDLLGGYLRGLGLPETYDHIRDVAKF